MESFVVDQVFNHSEFFVVGMWCMREWFVIRFLWFRLCLVCDRGEMYLRSSWYIVSIELWACFVVYPLLFPSACFSFLFFSFGRLEGRRERFRPCTPSAGESTTDIFFRRISAGVVALGDCLRLIAPERPRLTPNCIPWLKWRRNVTTTLPGTWCISTIDSGGYGTIIDLDRYDNDEGKIKSIYLVYDFDIRYHLVRRCTPSAGESTTEMLFIAYELVMNVVWYDNRVRYDTGKAKFNRYHTISIFQLISLPNQSDGSIF